MILVGLFAVVGGAWYLMTATPVASPDESHRQRHLAGFSMVCPEDWASKAASADGPGQSDYLMFLPMKNSARTTSLLAFHYPSGRSAESFTQADFHPGTFQGQPAYIFDGMMKKDYVYAVAFSRDNAWYEIRLVLPAKQPVIGTTWADYLNTFRIDKPAATTQPR